MFFYILIVLFRLTSDISYIYFINPLYEYAGFSLDIYFSKYVTSLIILIITLPLIKPIVSKVSDYFFISYVLFVIVPLSSLYGLTNWNVEPLSATILSFYLFVFLTKIKSPKSFYLPYVRYGEKIAISICSFFMALLTIRYISSGSYFNMDLSKVYDFRLLNSELSATGIFAYLNNWTYQIFSIFFISYFLDKKNWPLVIIGVLLQVLFYGYSSHKSVLFSLLLLFGIWYWFKRSNKAFVLPLSLIILYSISLFTYFTYDSSILGSLFIRRVFYLPSYLTHQYFNFFNDNPNIYWSNSFLSHFIKYPFNISISEVIGHYDGNDASANNGYVSMGFAHFSYFGIFIYTLIFAFILRIFDTITKDVGYLWLSLAITITPLRAALISSDLLTTLLTHGLLVAIFLVFLIRKKSNAHVY